MATEIMTVEQLIKEAVKLKLVLDDRDFCEMFFNLSPGYYGSQKENVGIAPLLNCWNRLVACGQFALAMKVWDMLQERNKTNRMSESLKNKPRPRRAYVRRRIDAMSIEAENTSNL